MSASVTRNRLRKGFGARPRYVCGERSPHARGDASALLLSLLPRMRCGAQEEWRSDERDEGGASVSGEAARGRGADAVLGPDVRAVADLESDRPGFDQIGAECTAELQ